MKCKSILIMALAFVRLAACAVGVAAAGRAPVALKPVAATDELRQELERYRFKAYSYGEGPDAFHCLHYAPKAQGVRRMPMVIYIPGCGEKGADLMRQFRQRIIFGRVTSAAFQKAHPCHLLAVSPPDSMTTMLGGMPGHPNALQSALYDMIQAVIAQAKPAVDRTRLYVTGFSYGGSGAYALALHHPGEFAATVPIAAIPPLAEYFTREHPGNFWHFHNEGDYSRHGISPRKVEEFRDLVNAAGGDFRMGTYPADSHDAWSRAWREDEVWNWMFSKSTAAAAKRPGGAVPMKKTSVALALNGVRCSSSIDGADAGTGPARVVDGLDETYYAPARPFAKTDWWQAEFPSPVAGKVTVCSGDRSGGRRIRQGYVEVSANGRTWSRVGSFSARDGVCAFSRSAPFSFLRVRLTSDKAEPFVLRRLSVFPSGR